MELPQARYTVNDKNHRYTITLPDGSTVGPLKSVTGVLGVIAKPALISWAAKMAAQTFEAEILRRGKDAFRPEVLHEIAELAKNAHRKTAGDAADLGTEIHAILDAIIHGKEPELVRPELVEPTAAFKAYRLQSDIEIVATEIAVASLQHRFGGRIDWIGYSKARGGWLIGDWKTSNALYGEHALQAGGGYALAAEEMFGIEIPAAEIVRFAKKPPYESEARPVVDIVAAKQGFLNALALSRTNDMEFLGEPTFTSAGKKVEAEAAPKKKKTAAHPVGF